MFDIGFWELSVIGVIALLVVGPERLPAMARTLGLWVGRVRRYVSHVRDDIEREIQAEELRELMKDSGELNSIGESLKEARDTLEDVKRGIDSDDRALTEEEDKQTRPESPSAIDAATTSVADSVSGARPPSGDAEAGEKSGPESSDPSENERRSG